jgi:hypothetical protein
MVETEQINPPILVWARETAGLSLEAAAEKLGLTSSSRSTAEAVEMAVSHPKTAAARKPSRP